MMRPLPFTQLFCFAQILSLFCSPNFLAQTGVRTWLELNRGEYDVHATGQDSLLLGRITSAADSAMTGIRSFFGHPFNARFDLVVFPDRQSLDRQWRSAWNDSTFQSECWMVAGGVAERLDLLSPRVWKTQACEHDPADSSSFLRLLAHELVHVFHGQHNPKPKFDGLDSLAWFIEGVATYASGQLDERRLAETRLLVHAGKAPPTLGTFWTGKARYGMAGSMALFIDTTYGRQVLYRLLTFTDQRSMLAMLKRSERSLLDSWKQFILAETK